MGFDFRYYGHAPADWYEGANDGHLFEILFRREPSPDDKAQLADLFERALSSGPARGAAAPWSWSGAFCRFLVGERWSSAPRLAFARVTDVLMDMRRVVPIEQVVFHGAREPGNSNWARWTSSVQPVPTPGPPGLDPAMCHTDASLAAPVTDDAFEKARAATRAMLRQQRTRAAGEKSGTGLALVPCEPPATVAAAAPEVLAKFRIPDPPTSQKAYGKQFHTVLNDGDHLSLLTHKTPRLIAIVHQNGRKIGLAYLDDAGERREVHVAGAIGPAVSPDASRCLVGSGVELIEIDFATGVATARWRAEGVINGVAFLDERWAVKTDKELVVLEPGERPEIVASLKVSGSWITAILGGTVIATSTYPKSIDFVGFCEGKLKKLASLKTYLGSPKEIDGEIVYRGVDGDTYVLDGLDELYQAWAGPMREKAEAARKKALARLAKRAAPARLKAALEPVALADVPETDPLETPPSDEDRARFASHALVRRAPSGRLAALVPRSGMPANAYVVSFVDAAWIDATGALRPLKLGKPPPDSATLSADGELLVVRNLGGSVHFIDLESEARATFDVRNEELGNGSRMTIAPHRDLVVFAYDKGIAWWQRDADTWREVGRAKVAGFTSVVVNPARALACCLSSAKARLVIYRAKDGALAKVASFTERIREVRSHGDRIYALSVDGEAFELTGV